VGWAIGVLHSSRARCLCRRPAPPTTSLVTAATRVPCRALGAVQAAELGKRTQQNAAQIYEGTNQIQRVVIAKKILGSEHRSTAV
jgi:hypothetical protein